MKARVLKKFIDLSEGVERDVGCEFECTVARFNEIKQKLPDFVERIDTPKKTTKKTRK